MRIEIPSFSRVCNEKKTVFKLKTLFQTRPKLFEKFTYQGQAKLYMLCCDAEVKNEPCVFSYLYIYAGFK